MDIEGCKNSEGHLVVGAPGGLTLDSATLKTQADTVLGTVVKVAGLFPAGTAIVPIATLLQTIVDNDDFRNQIVTLWNKL